MIRSKDVASTEARLPMYTLPVGFTLVAGLTEQDFDSLLSELTIEAKSSSRVLKSVSLYSQKSSGVIP